MNYKVQDHLKPKALTGISDDQIGQHWKLYEGYVKSANGLLDGTAKAEAGSPVWAELKRRLGFEVDGIVLHEYYFGTSPPAPSSPRSALAVDLGAAWGSVAAWREDFTQTGGMRGSAWRSSTGSRHRRPLQLVGIEPRAGHPAGFNPVLVLTCSSTPSWWTWPGGGGVHRGLPRERQVEVVEQRHKDSKAGVHRPLLREDIA